MSDTRFIWNKSKLYTIHYEYTSKSKTTQHKALERASTEKEAIELFLQYCIVADDPGFRITKVEYEET